VKFAILGPLQVTGENDIPIAVSQARQRALVGVLLLHRRQPVAPSRLADMLWGDDPPKKWRGSLRTHIWHIRGRLPEGRLGHDSGGYCLKTRAGELDLDEFRQFATGGREALDRGDHASAATQLGHAVALWRDPPLADLPDTPAVTAITRRLLDERRAAEDELADTRLELGEHRSMLVDLRARAAEGDTDERVWERLMVALYRSGMRAAALQTFTQARRLLADDFGIEPGPGLRQLQQQILRDDPALGRWHADPGRASR